MPHSCLPYAEAATCAACSMPPSTSPPSDKRPQEAARGRVTRSPGLPARGGGGERAAAGAAWGAAGEDLRRRRGAADSPAAGAGFGPTQALSGCRVGASRPCRTAPRALSFCKSCFVARTPMMLYSRHGGGWGGGYYRFVVSARAVTSKSCPGLLSGDGFRQTVPPWNTRALRSPRPSTGPARPRPIGTRLSSS